MAWIKTAFDYPNNVKEAGFNRKLKAALASLSLPDNIAKENLHANNAKIDSDRRESFDIFDLPLEHILINPWEHGRAAGNKQNANFWLSSTDALTRLKKNLEVVDWESCIVILISGANADVIADSLEVVLTAFPNQQLQRCYRHARALASHDNDKIFIKSASINIEVKTTLSNMTAFNAVKTARQNISISESIASDSNPIDLLKAFKEKRISRLDSINNAISSLRKSTSFPYAAHLTGEYLGDALANQGVPDEAAPLCCVLAIGGKSIAVTPLKEVLSL